ncbi:hypothetical protein ACQ5SO_01025 [Rhodovulum sp. DZ06]|uniref:hypothetical protein n=1 Tax=Rhodovulum sp. DZ06 TaxID=3425126 RepID=UPI003D32AC7D
MVSTDGNFERDFAIRRHAPGAARATSGEFEAPRRRRSRGLGLRSAPAALLLLCLGFLGFFAWAAVDALPAAQGGIGGVAGGDAFAPSPMAQAAALLYMLGTPAVLFFVRRRYWRKMRTWLRRATSGVALLWALAAAASLVGGSI